MKKSTLQSTLKNMINVERLLAPGDFYKRSESVGKRFPNKIPVAEWFNIGPATQLIVWPYSPIPSAMIGGARFMEYPNYEGLRKSWKWRWEYFHNNGDAQKIGKKGGLYIYEDDPLMVPPTLVNGIYFLIFRTHPTDFVNKGKIPNDE